MDWAGIDRLLERRIVTNPYPVLKIILVSMGWESHLGIFERDTNVENEIDEECDRPELIPHFARDRAPNSQHPPLREGR
jgi:hypothetical protein